MPDADAVPDAGSAAAAGRSTLLVDWGGVLTSSVTRSFRAHSRALGLPPDLVRDVLLEAYAAPHDDGPVHRLETGRLSVDAFAAQLAALLSDRSGVTVPADGLVERLLAGVAVDERMVAAVAAVRAAGVRTGLLSNSWGDAIYPWDRFPGLFDAVVISAQVGLRKPDPAIYALAARRLGVPPSACVFVDDLDANVAAAEAVGMTAVVHRAVEETLPRVAALLGLDLAVVDAARTRDAPTGDASV